MDKVVLNRGTMDLQHLSTHGLLMLYQAVKLALDEDERRPHDRLFQVRGYPTGASGRTGSRTNSTIAARVSPASSGSLVPHL